LDIIGGSHGGDYWSGFSNEEIIEILTEAVPFWTRLTTFTLVIDAPITHKKAPSIYELIETCPKNMIFVIEIGYREGYARFENMEQKLNKMKNIKLYDLFPPTIFGEKVVHAQIHF